MCCIEKELTIYNINKDDFKCCVSSRYLPTENKICRYDDLLIDSR